MTVGEDVFLLQFSQLVCCFFEGVCHHSEATIYMLIQGHEHEK